MISLRPYQTEALRRVEDKLSAGVQRQLVVLPTGSGKTIIFAELARRRSGRVLVLAHRDELIRQTIDKIRMVDPAADVGVVKAAENDMARRIVVASIQTLQSQRRIDELFGQTGDLFGSGPDSEGAFSTIVIDEAHHASAPTYKAVIDRCTAEDEDALLLGVTATPARSDKRHLDQVFSEIVYSRSILDMIREGYLCDVRGVRVEMHDFDVRTIAQSRGDYQAGAIGEALTDAGGPRQIVDAWIQHAEGRRSIVFAPTVATAQSIAAEFEARGVNAAAAWGDMPIDERRATLERFKAGELQVVSNAMILTEGYDDPGVECVVVARPTKSHGLYVQMVGRGTRPYPGKSNLLVLDVVGATRTHSLQTVVSLLGRGTTTESESRSERLVSESGLMAAAQAFDVDVEHKQMVAEKVAVFERSRFAWVQTDKAWMINAGEDTVIVEPSGDAWAVVKVPRVGRMVRLHDDLDFGFAQGIAEDLVRESSALIFADRNASWRGRPASAKQLGLLRRYRVDIPPGLTSGDASDLITRVMGEARRRSN